MKFIEYKQNNIQGYGKNWMHARLWILFSISILAFARIKLTVTCGTYKKYVCKYLYVQTNLSVYPSIGDTAEEEFLIVLCV